MKKETKERIKKGIKRSGGMGRFDDLFLEETEEIRVRDEEEAFKEALDLVDQDSAEIMEG